MKKDEQVASEDELAAPDQGMDFAEAPGEEYVETQTIAPTLLGPEDGYSRVYNETSTPAEFTWQGDPGGWLVISESPSMSPVMLRRRASGNSHRVRKLVPGTYYWQVRNGAGRSGVRSIVVYPAPLRQIALETPSEGGSLAGNGGTITWSGDTGISYYRVEVSNSGWANPSYRFATTGTQLAVQGVASGQYELRVGAFSEVSGRWEYAQPINVSVQ